MSLNNTTALITGASRGLGRALALILARRGVASSWWRATRRSWMRRPPVPAWARAASLAGVSRGILGDEQRDLCRRREAAALVGPGRSQLIHNRQHLGTTPLPLLWMRSVETLEKVLRWRTFLDRSVGGKVIATV